MSSELMHLVKMINQISDNQPKQIAMEDAAKNVANHINRFWAKPMRQKLLKEASQLDELLTPVSLEAIKTIH
jgi:formate dehydrogenase subunit delta